MIRVLVADDHKLARQGFATLLMRAKDIEIVAEATDGQQAIEQAQKLEPDVILMDVQMPRLDGFCATQQLRAMGHPARVLMVSLMDAPETTREAARSGARGFFLKGGSREELIEAIHAIYGGKRYASPTAASSFLEEPSR